MTKMSDLLFHYCSTQAFHSIISNRSIWLSSLTSSNDSTEGKLAADLLHELVNLQEPSPEKVKKIAKTIKNFESIADGVGFCLSKEKDRLSQWRGYADDGRGLSIGFSKEYIAEKICITSDSGADIKLEEVVYEKHGQDLILMQYCESLMKLNNSVESEAVDRFELAKQLIKNRFKIKNSSFKEEAEWRLLSFFIVGTESNKDILFRSSSNRLTPYLNVPLPQNSKAILEVDLGPKNTTPKNVVEMFLNAHGFHNVKVEQSKSTYR